MWFAGAPVGRPLRAVAAVTLAMACMPLTPAVADAAADTFCSAQLNAHWDPGAAVCSTAVKSIQGADMTIAVGLPVALMDNPTAGPVIGAYAAHLFNGWRQTGQNMQRDNNAGADYTLYSASGSVVSVVFHEYFNTAGSLPNNAYKTFTFDLAHGKQLQLADIVTPGVDPLSALPPLLRPYLIPALDAAPPPHPPGTYPFQADRFEPQPDGSGFAQNYRAWALTPDELILYLPGEPMMHESPVPRGQMVWSMDGGVVIVHVPRSALASILRPI
jgi:hypothetical protein